MKINKKTFDFTFVITTAVTLIIFSEFNLLENIPKSRAGKIVEAAKPNAKATTCATKAGG